MRSTEYISARYHNLDIMPDEDVLMALWQDQAASIAAVHAALGSIEDAAGQSFALLENGGRLIYAGAGSSGALALLDAFELRGTFGWPQERLATMVAGFSGGLQTAFVGGYEDDFDAGITEAVALNLTEKDVVLAIAASGSTPYTLGVCEVAKAAGSLLIGIANNSCSELLQTANIAIQLDTGPEVVAGSTRLGAGTAQRAVLSVFSTLLMIKLGHVYNNTMVNLIADNKKLVRRALRILESATNQSQEKCQKALDEAEGLVKVAILILADCSVEEAKQLLDENRGNVRHALAAK